ncbi:endolytic transglycosylase MltG [Paraglaciecola chathamensis]|uniref:endolytic transglycosylase MltG n=1 Tax=Paraglaciecola chathamensis TaxID=368405 RepID=UPI0026F4CAEF|nr:endolytic transglycosylase MltG [Paraglaciecola chathamensis]MDO6840948.1 endolytic transglycosylase MltG [Paraglaciecola chathamensis]
MRINIIKVSSLLITVVIVTIMTGLHYLKQQAEKPLSIDEPFLLTINKGQFSNSILKQLQQQSLVDDTLGLKVMLKVMPELAKVKAGTYELIPGMNGIDVFQLIASGKEKQFALTLVEGLRWQDWKQQITHHPYIHFGEDFNDNIQAFTQDIEGQSLEGWLMPDTYHFVAGTKAFTIVKWAYNEMRKELDLQWQNRYQNLPYATPYEALIMASIIEKETAKAQERSRISGVFVNRLRLNMRLQTDPTVIYGIKDFDGDIRRKDLRQATPYNTYVIKGLTPTPIAMPSKLAIHAALNPLATDELYFVSKGDGSHHFSQTLQEHNRAVRQYQLKR